MAAAQPLKIRMVAGLGNPGEEYAETRHNAGFKAIDELARQAGVTYWKNQAGAEVALINIKMCLRARLSAVVDQVVRDRLADGWLDQEVQTWGLV